jgi:hypothetical protein
VSKIPARQGLKAFTLTVSLGKRRFMLNIAFHNCRMSFSKKYDLRIPQLTERIHEFLRAKHLTGQVEHEFNNVNEPTGWATLTVDTADPVLDNELDGFISNLERMAVVESETNLSDGSYKTQDPHGTR